MSRILVVDDKELMRDSVAATLVRKGHTVVCVPSAKAGLEKLTQRAFHAVITDLQMPEMDGVAFLGEIRKLDEQLPVILMTAYGTVETAVEAMRQGAYDYITKPFSGDELLVAVERAIEHAKLLKENQILRASSGSSTGGNAHAHKLIGSGPSMEELRSRIRRVADSHGTVLITGESGAGKEVAARMIHQESPRRDMPFLAINCAALSTNLLESELFGHEKGAFTGADKMRKGRFELADGGTLLLDEISEIAPEIQAKLLRVLQERTFERVGASTSRTVDVRVIATTNRDLPSEVAAGTFRQDLFFRLNVLPMPMPALREHVEDMPALVEHFLAQVASREGKPVKRMEPAAIELLQHYRWPGNVREMQNVCERAAVLTQGETISAALIQPWLLQGRAAAQLSTGGASAAAMHANVMHGMHGTNGEAREHTPEIQMIGGGNGLHGGNGMHGVHGLRATPKPASMIEAHPMRSENGADGVTGANGEDPQSLPRIICNGELTLDDVEREIIIATLKHNNGHRQRSAKALGIGVRTLGLKLKKWKEAELVAQSL